MLRRSVIEVRSYRSVPIRLLSEASNEVKSEGSKGEERQKKRTRVVLC